MLSRRSIRPRAFQFFSRSSEFTCFRRVLSFDSSVNVLLFLFVNKCYLLTSSFSFSDFFLPLIQRHRHSVMAYVLSLQPHSPLKRSFSDTPYLRSCSSLSIASSSGTVRHETLHSLSTGSLVSCPSAGANSFPLPYGNPSFTSSPQRSVVSVRSATSAPTSSIASIIPSKSQGNPSVKHQENVEAPRDSVIESDITDVETPNIDSRLHTPEITVDLEEVPGANQPRQSPPPNILEVLSRSNRRTSIDNQLLSPQATDPDVVENGPPLKRWVSTLRRRNLQRRKPVASQATDRWYCGDESNVRSPRRSNDLSQHRKSLSQSSSMGFITAVKSASITLASASIGPLRSRSSNPRGSGNSEVRASMDSTAVPLSPILDEATWLRSLQRRKILEELVSTEESYLADMKAFVNVRTNDFNHLLANVVQVYSTLLASMPTMPSQIRTSVEQTVTQIVQLHDELLGELYKVLPNAETMQDASLSKVSTRPRKHSRWHSADVALPRHDSVAASKKLRHSFDGNRAKEDAVAMTSTDTETVAKVAKVFNKFVSHALIKSVMSLTKEQMRRFLVYEAWAAHSESMHKDVLSTYRSVPAWPAFERGLESLATLETSINSRESNNRKGLTLPDMLIKVSGHKA